MRNFFWLFLGTATLGSSKALFAAEDMQTAPPDQSFLQTMVMIAIGLLFFYLILWRPEQKRRKALEEQRSAMKLGDRVVAMGIIGTIAKMSEETVILKMVDGSKIEVYKAAISDILPSQEEKGSDS